MIFEDTKEKLEWHKRAFECKQKIAYGIESQNDMKRIHDKVVNKITECNVLHDIINPPKRAINCLFSLFKIHHFNLI